MKDTNGVQIRNLTVCGHFAQRQFARTAFVPQIRLIGKWLREAGFEVGDRIKVIVTKQCLLIIPDEKKQEDL